MQTDGLILSRREHIPRRPDKPSAAASAASAAATLPATQLHRQCQADRQNTYEYVGKLPKSRTR